MLRTQENSWDRAPLMGKKRMCWKQTYLLLQFCLEPVLHLTFPEINLSVNQTRTVWYLLGFAKAHMVVVDLLPCISPPLSGAKHLRRGWEQQSGS